MKLYNSLTTQIEDVHPLSPPAVSVYSCGPTVYDRVHIGNLSAFITADILRRTLSANGYQVRHVMNLTDVDDKTIKRSREEYTELDPRTALTQTTTYYTEYFMRDTHAIGNDIAALEFITATDPATIDAIETMIAELHTGGIAYVADDGIYFSIAAYKKTGKTYGQLVDLSAASTSSARIDNDEYDKESAHDFALWKFAKDDEPTWTIAIGDKSYAGRPGWHIECSAMTRLMVGQPFDIHTGGIDLKFPHHENEIAQSTACTDNPTFATMFIHNEHVLVDGRKMSKSLNNFYTLEDLLERGIKPLAFRMLVLQSHYRSATNFTFEALDSAAARLTSWRNYAALRHQTHSTISGEDEQTQQLLVANQALLEHLSNDLDTPNALAWIDKTFASLDSLPPERIDRAALVQFLQTIDTTFGLQLLQTAPDISDDIKRLIVERERARDEKDWTRSDEIRNEISNSSGIQLLDTPTSTVWHYA